MRENGPSSMMDHNALEPGTRSKSGCTNASTGSLHRICTTKRWYLTSIDDTTSDFDPSLFIVAHEAESVKGPQAVSAETVLECPEVLPGGLDKTSAGSGLIRLEPQHHTLIFDDDDNGEGSSDKESLNSNPCAQCTIEDRSPRGGEGNLPLWNEYVRLEF
ncbi:hypothetical protein EV401DRAFT_2207578 [Pisolithus croceorrhizus]|nr:hypothetical protein EV401DRAFT_2207578 [Pisolithus croceorrhizus]